MFARIDVFLLDDHEGVRQALRNQVESEVDIEVVGESASAVDACRRIPLVRPRVAILDARVPDGDGVEVCRYIRSVIPSCRTVILTSANDDAVLSRAIAAGASGYLTKQIVGFDLADVVRRVVAGEVVIDPTVATRI
jgi:two-component system, NarL family, response regulator DevR